MASKFFIQLGSSNDYPVMKISPFPSLLLVSNENAKLAAVRLKSVILPSHMSSSQSVKLFLLDCTYENTSQRNEQFN